jgi:predicted ATP-dependent Lon-type protease
VAKKGVNLVVYQHQMERVIIQSALLKFGEKEVLVEMQMLDKNKKQLKAVIWTIFVHYNLKTLKNEFHSENFTQKFKALEIPLEEETTFEERVNFLKQR